MCLALPVVGQTPDPDTVGVADEDVEERGEPSYLLEQVVVSASGSEQVLVTAPASISVRTREDLTRTQIRSISEALQGIPGLDIDGTDARSNKTGNRTVSLRGLPSEYTLVLIDGRRQNVPGTVAPNAFNDSGVAFFPPVSAIERIEVVRGPMSTLYGADALGGVVNIITRRAESEWGGDLTLDGTIQSDSQFGGSRTVEGYVGGPLGTDRLSLQLYGRAFQRSASNIEFPGQDRSVDRRRTMGQVPTDADIHTAGGRLTFTPHPAHRIYLSLDATRQTYDNSQGQLGQINVEAEPGTDASPDLLRGYAPELGFNRNQVNLGHTGRFSLGSLENSLSRNVTETVGRTIPASAATEESGRRGAPRTLESETVVLDTRFTVPARNHIVTVGGQYLDASLTDGIPERTFSTTQFGLFVENEWRATDRLSFTGGLRYDDNSGFGGQLSPRVYSVFRATDAWTVKGGVGRGYRAPFLEQLEDGIIGYGDQGTVPLFGNPDLRPELSTNTEASVRYDAGGRVTGSVTLFHTELTDKIERPVGATAGVTDNVGQARLQGVESAARFRLAPSWTVSGEYTFTRSEVTTSEAQGIREGDPLFGVPAHMLNGRVQWSATSALEIRVGGEYRSSRHRPHSFHEPRLGGSAQGASEALGAFRSYALFHAGAAYRVSERLQLRANVENLLDRDFVDYRPYPLRNDPSVTGYSNLYNNILEPRRLWVSLNTSL